MIASQFILDDRLAELRRAGPDIRVAQARAAGQRDGSTARSFVDSIRALLGGSTAGRHTVELAGR